MGTAAILCRTHRHGPRRSPDGFGSSLDQTFAPRIAYTAPVNQFHGVIGLIALLTGALILTLKQGTPLHKRLGKIYVGAMYTLCITSFFIFELFGRFGVFHVFSLVSLATVSAGLIPLIRKREGWYRRHFENMVWSYFGLVLATCSHFFGFVFGYLKSQGASRPMTWIVTALIVWGIPHLVGIPLIARKCGYFQPKPARTYFHAACKEIPKTCPYPSVAARSTVLPIDNKSLKFTLYCLGDFCRLDIALGVQGAE